MSALDRDAATLAADRLKVFGQPQRLMILTALVDQELAVGAIELGTGVTQPALSQQLAELRRAGLVAQRRLAKQVLYRLADERTETVVRFISYVFGRDGEPSTGLKSIERPVAPTQVDQSAAMFAVIDQD